MRIEFLETGQLQVFHVAAEVLSVELAELVQVVEAQTPSAGQVGQLPRVAFEDLDEPLPGERALLYELGIPVVETGTAGTLTLDRTNVPPAYLWAVRVAVLNALATRIVGEEATQP